MSTPDFLLVDDDEAFTQVLKRALDRRGFSCRTAANAKQALRMAKVDIFAHAVVDLKIAADSGLKLIPALKQLRPDMAIVMLTGYSSVATAVEAVKLGAVNYLCKPASVDEILAAFTATDGNPDIDLPELRPSIDRLEWEHIQTVLKENDGNISATARALGMHRRTLQRKLQKRPVRQ